MDIIEFEGLDPRLFTRIGPLVMNPKVLKANNNYPFKTSERFYWYVALSGRKVVGFLPVERKKGSCVINNYYMADGNADILTELLQAVPQQESLHAVVQTPHEEVFAACGYEAEHRWTKYVRMRRVSNKTDNETEHPGNDQQEP